MEESRFFEPGTKVRHFKHVRLNMEDRCKHKYEYEVVGHGVDTETGKVVVIYRPLCEEDRGKLWVRPAESFYSRIDKVKYPYATQEYRLEKIGDKVES